MSVWGSLDIYQPLYPASPAVRAQTSTQNIPTSSQMAWPSDQDVTLPLSKARKEAMEEETRLREMSSSIMTVSIHELDRKFGTKKYRNYFYEDVCPQG